MLAAGGRELRDIVRDNIGQSGVDRPAPWPPLTPRYAKRVDRSYATLLKSGRLKADVRLIVTYTYAEVSCGETAPYAEVHQNGGGNKIPARPYFPIQGGKLTASASIRVIEAMTRAVEAKI